MMKHHRDSMTATMMMKASSSSTRGDHHRDWLVDLADIDFLMQKRMKSKMRLAVEQHAMHRMQMQWMRIVGAVMKRQPVARALFEQKLLVVGIGFAVHREAVEFAGAARYREASCGSQ